MIAEGLVVPSFLPPFVQPAKTSSILDATVVDALDYAVDAVGGQGGQSLLLRRPLGRTSAAGRQDDQRPVPEVTQRCRCLRGGARLDLLVDRAAEMACGRHAH